MTMPDNDDTVLPVNTTNIVVVQEQREPVTIGFISVLLLAAFVGLVATYFWQILACCLVLTVGILAVRAEMRHRRSQQRLSNQADYQNRLYLEGDPRGVYGDEGPQR